jgi:hypothetical protein
MSGEDRVGLVVVFNHRFDQNIPRLVELYRERFEHVRFLVPAYTGDRPDVRAVLENALCFQGYFSQALDFYRDARLTHYAFVGDDAVLGREVSGRSLPALLGLDARTAWVKSLTAVADGSFKWARGCEAIACVNHAPGIERYRALLPDDAEWDRRLARHGIPTGRDLGLRNLRAARSAAPVNAAESFRPYRGLLGDLATLCLPARTVRRLAARTVPVASRMARRNLRRRTLAVPLVSSYSDVVVVPAPALDEFARLCGIFAAMNLFVEVAVPTALALAAERIRTEADGGPRGLEVWGAEATAALEARCERSVARLPGDVLYVHPVKLSRWSVGRPAPDARAGEGGAG